MVLIERIIKSRRINYGDIGGVADTKPPRVQAVPLTEFTGESMHGGFEGHKRSTRLAGLLHAFEQPQPRVVKRHIPQVRAGVVVTQLEMPILDGFVENIGAVVGDGGMPTHLSGVLRNEIEERVHRLHTASVGHLPE
ncbi:Uncharacterised protein [Mycobacteroides abscessus subsp. abscessus]|nr:Uncharacterised protein [Mycobacteroides abscessus subsp. abscessus]